MATTDKEFKLYYDGRLVNTFHDLAEAINHYKVLHESESTKCGCNRKEVTLMCNDTDVTQMAIASDYVTCK